MNNRLLLATGYLVPLIFWTTTLVCGFMWPEYSHASQMVSELGELGSKTQQLFTAGLVASALFSAFFNWGLFKACRQMQLNPLPVLFLWFFTFSIGGAGLFPYPLRWHAWAGSPSFLLILSPLLALVLWKAGTVKKHLYFALLSLFLFALGFSIYFPGLWADFFGLKQRFFHLGWTLWFLYLAVAFGGADKISRETL